MKCKPSKDIKNIIMNIEKNNYKYDRVDYINTKKKANIVTVNNYYNNSNKVTVPVDNKTVTLLDIINIERKI